MEPPTPRIMPWLLLLCLVADGLLQALAQSNPPGFISIDCGLPGETGYVDNATTLSYTTDAGFIGAYVGSNHIISAKYMNSSAPNKWSNTLRSFPDGTRNCYTLGSLVPGLKYLIRAKFLYGNYDGLDNLPFFDLYVGVDFWTTVNIRASNTWELAEAIVMVPRDSVQVCLVKTDGGVPFISALDLRQLRNKLYTLVNATQGMVLLHRFNFGPTDGNATIRYPDDPFDRMWLPISGDPTADWDEISTERKVEIADDRFQPPQAVMQTASTPKNSFNNIEFTLNLHSSPTDRSLGYMEMIYFSELEPLPSNALRQYNIYRNGAGTTTNYTPNYLRDGYSYSTEPFQASQYSLSINATDSATLPPIINAIELFSVISTTTLGTDPQHVFAITAIKEMYQVQKNWMGDPCVPNTMVWDGLTCIYSISKPPIISNVNVSFSGLNHTISPDFANLTDVRYLDLSNNNLIGSIPDTLSQLPSLIFLDLSNNKLSGSIPFGLAQKVQDGSLDLRYGDNPDLCPNGNACQHAKGDSKLAIHIVVPVVVIVALVLVAILGFWLQRKRNQGSIRNPVNLANDGDWNISLARENRQFTYMELEVITKNFQRSLGKGGFGFVFHGSLEKGTEVAVKLRSHSSNQGIKEFLAEAQVLTLIHHKNLVSMIGYCNDGGHMALVYEYMPQGSLKELIAEDNNKQCLPWGQRLRVALESAQGLEYLHKGCSPPIIHRDVKTANILLNARLEAKIADFGLSKAFDCEDDTHVSTNTFVGTLGYADPEYQRTMQPSMKSDVYSFGVVLLELVTGKPAIVRNPETVISLVNWTRQRLAWGDIEGVVDTRMQGDHDINAVWKTTEIALKCTEQSPLQRPSMTDVVMQLQECLDLEEGFKRGDSGLYTGSGNGGMDPNMGYNTTTNQSIDVSQNNATLR